MHTATFEINIYNNPTARRITDEDIEIGMDDDAGVMASVHRDSAYLTIRVSANLAGDAADWLTKMGLI